MSSRSIDEMWTQSKVCRILLFNSKTHRMIPNHPFSECVYCLDLCTKIHHRRGGLLYFCFLRARAPCFHETLFLWTSYRVIRHEICELNLWSASCWICFRFGGRELDAWLLLLCNTRTTWTYLATDSLPGASSQQRDAWNDPQQFGQWNWEVWSGDLGTYIYIYIYTLYYTQDLYMIYSITYMSFFQRSYSGCLFVATECFKKYFCLYVCVFATLKGVSCERFHEFPDWNSSSWLVNWWVSNFRASLWSLWSF